MTYNPNVPNASQSPGLFPTQNNTNFARLKTLINADHVFNDSAQSTDGVHRQVTMVARTTPVSLPAGTNAILYTKVDTLGASQLNFWNGSENFLITPQVAVRAVVNFKSDGSIRSQFNVTSVTKNATGDYTINFTNPMPDTNYIVQVTGQRNASGEVIVGCIRGNNTFSSVATTTTLRVNFFGSSDSLRDITTGCVTVMSII